MKEQGIGHSHAKIILMGEHSVVYGQPAIALPLPNVKLTAQLTANDKGKQLIESRYFSGAFSQLPEQMKGIHKLINHLMDIFDGHNDGWTLSIKSDLPAERGMGSSAATAIAIIRAFFEFYGKVLDRETLLQLADIEEKVTHRSPSGLDAATVSSTSPIYFIKGEKGTPITMNLHATMVIADTGIKGATKEAIDAVKTELSVNPTKANERIKHLGKLTNQAKDFLNNDEVEKLGITLTTAHQDLVALNVSNPALDKLVQVANQNNAFGAKLTGGGRGGCMFAITHTALDARRLAVILQANGAQQIWLQPLNENDMEESY
ncbi:mevalonate kinase [Lactobacillaceae bacterium 24-114]